MLEKGEKIAWEGSMNRKAIFMSAILSEIVVLVLTKIPLFMGGSDGVINYVNEESGKPGEVSAWLIAGTILGVGTLIVLVTLWSNLKRHFAVTNKRILMSSGIIGADFKSIYYDQVKNAFVKVDLFDKIFKVGTVALDTGAVEMTKQTSNRGVSVGSQIKPLYTKLKHIETPYEVYKMVQSHLSGRKESLYSGRADRESQAAKKK